MSLKKFLAFYPICFQNLITTVKTASAKIGEKPDETLAKTTEKTLESKLEKNTEKKKEEESDE